MNTKHLFLATSFAFLAAGSAFAQEATPDTWRDIAASTPRAVVHAAAVDAVKNDQIAYGEGSRLPGSQDLSASTLTRVQVRAEAVAALRMGLLHTGEFSAPAFTPEQNRVIHQAGLQAVQQYLARAGR